MKQRSSRAEEIILKRDQWRVGEILTVESVFGIIDQSPRKNYYRITYEK